MAAKRVSSGRPAGGRNPPGASQSGYRESVHAAHAQPQSLKRYYRVLIEHAWIIVLCVLVAVGAAAVYVVTAPRKYTAQAQMLVTPVPASNSALIGLPVLHSSGDPTSDVLTAASLITTTQVASGVVEALQLRETPTQLLSQVQATPIGQSNLEAVQAEASSPAKAQAIANEFVLQVVVTRAVTLHGALATLIPALRAQAAAVPAGQRNGPGTVGDQLFQLEQLASSNDPTITIASLADRPTSPSSPRTKLTLIAALFGGLILGIGAAFAFDALDPRLRREDQLRDGLGVPILARIPRERRAALGRPILPDELSFGGVESYRTLRTILKSRSGGRPRSILITGSEPAEGKTTCAINLAAALAHGGSGVILIDADLRHSSIASALGLQIDYGIDDLLTGQADLDEALAVADFGNATVGVLALKRPDADLADRLTPAVAQHLIRQTMAVSDFVVIDSPPLTSVSDALPLAELADEVLIVARIGASKLTKLRELHDLLSDQGTYSTGIVIIGQPGPPGRRDRYYRPDSDRPSIQDGQQSDPDLDAVQRWARSSGRSTGAASDRP